MDMVSTKSMWASKTVWAGVCTFIAGAISTGLAVAAAVGHPVDPATTQLLTTVADAALNGLTPDRTTQLVTGVVTSLGGIMAIVGRLTATRRIG